MFEHHLLSPDVKPIYLLKRDLTLGEKKQNKRLYTYYETNLLGTEIQR